MTTGIAFSILGGVAAVALILKVAADNGLIDAVFDNLEYKSALRARNKELNSRVKKTRSAHSRSGVLGLNDSPQTR